MDTNHFDTVDIETSLPESFCALYALWNAWRDGAAMPNIKQFQMDMVPLSLLPWSAIVEIVDNDGTRDFLYRFWGTERVKLIGAEMTGRLVSGIEDTRMRNGSMVEYADVCARGVPLLCTTPVTTPSGRQLSIASLRLPIADAAGNITRIFSATDPSTLKEISDGDLSAQSSHL